jgi:hypothetical protein
MWTHASRAPRAACLGSVAVALALTLVPTPTATASGVVLSATATPSQLSYRATLTVAGELSDGGQGVAGVPLALQGDAYPFRRFVTLARLSTAPDGSFSFAGVQPDRDTRLRVLVEGSAASVSPTLPVTVEPDVALAAHDLGRGRTRLSMRVLHTRHGGSAPVTAWWFTAARGTHRLHLAAVTTTREIAAGMTGVTYANAVVDPPSKRFLYRVCINPSWERAMGAPSAHHPCPHGDFDAPSSTLGRSAYEAEGRGTPLPAYPSAGAIAAAARYLDGRAGRISFAVVDSTGHVSGLRLHEHFETASVVKVMMLTAYLQMLAARHRDLSSSDTALLYPMIHISDNSAASAVFSIVGAGAVARVAREAGMNDYAPGVGWWAYTQTSAIDQARLFFMLDRLIPPRFYGYARYLMSTIEPSQSWGIPPVARPRWQVFFKTGALPERGLFNEVGRLERGPLTFTIAVFTDGDPSMGYGEQTIEGVADDLLASTP